MLLPCLRLSTKRSCSHLSAARRSRSRGLAWAGLPLVLGTTPVFSQPQTSANGLPPPPPPIGLPRLQAQVSCPSLQQTLQGLVGRESAVWSVTVTEPGGRLLADLKGTVPRIPASNQKLLSTAFALDRLGPDHHLATQLWRLPDGSFRVVGQGDPDFAIPDLQQLAGTALASLPTPSSPSVLQVMDAAAPRAGGRVRVELAEEPRNLWWPAGWHPQDRAEAYGAPITRLALTSNALDTAISDPLARFQRLLTRTLNRPGTPVQVVAISAQDPLPLQAELLAERPSAPMHRLLSLANTESHNFTAEVLFRQAAQRWDGREAADAASAWLAQQGLPMEGVRVVDGSGLDRSNRVTSRFLAALLLRMDHHPYSRDYLASMAIAGERGTLRNLFVGTSLQGRFHGKTGTISGVRAISGQLETVDGVRYISMVSNGASSPNRTIQSLLLAVQQDRRCGEGGTMALLP
jgi:D-alanyl-D-alanine carboxypeptidase/D-alanyl-D-alanine-endopeptidase (penicillin-binding protein 4)